jgi:hypothetical protein
MEGFDFDLSKLDDINNHEQAPHLTREVHTYQSTMHNNIQQISPQPSTSRSTGSATNTIDSQYVRAITRLKATLAYVYNENNTLTYNLPLTRHENAVILPMSFFRSYSTIFQPEKFINPNSTITKVHLFFSKNEWHAVFMGEDPDKIEQYLRNLFSSIVFDEINEIIKDTAAKLPK